jgi:hypothetical protein
MSQPDEFQAVPGPQHYVTAGYYTRQAAEAYELGQYESAAVLAAIGHVHATLAATAATALHEEYADIRAWRDATGQG